jgi:two-component system sensor histidine kinase/response regulator
MTNVLLVEDDIINQQVAVELFHRLGIEPDLASDGLEALTAFRRKNYDLILMDCQMPRMDGWQATRAIRALEGATKRARTPIVAYTALVTPSDMERCTASGMDKLLSKPIDLEKLDNSIRPFGLKINVQLNPDKSSQKILQPEQKSISDPILDSTVVCNLKALGDETFDGVVATFLEESFSRQQTINNALDCGDTSKLAKVFHAIKGVAGTLGGRQLALRSGEMDHLAKKRDIPSLRANMPAFLSLFEETAKALEASTSKTKNQENQTI